MPQGIRRKRFSVVTSLIAAVFVFPLACVVAAVVVRGVVVAVGDSIEATGVPITYPFDVMLVSIMIGLPLLLAYLASRACYSLMRWETVYHWDGRYCVQCEYDLTGNVSGRCPECGTPTGDSGGDQDGGFG